MNDAISSMMKRMQTQKKSMGNIDPYSGVKPTSGPMGAKPQIQPAARDGRQPRARPSGGGGFGRGRRF